MLNKLRTSCFTYLINNYNYVSKRFAGHSKWANIRHIKELKDSQRSKIFTKVSQYIKVAIQEGGSINPDNNLRLAQVIQQARRANMPLATVENVIKSTLKDRIQNKSVTFEIRGPGGCTILCEIFSPNVVKSKQDISSIMKKHFCRYSDSGGKHLFDHKGIIEAKLSDGPTEAALELATNHAIECEAEDVKLVDDSKLQFICEARSFHIVQKNLDTFKYQISDAYLHYIPHFTVPLTDNDLEVCSIFYDKLENMPEVVKLYDNIA